VKITLSDLILNTRSVSILIIQTRQLLAVTHIDGLLSALASAADDSFSGKEIGVMFSGGIDSCVIAELARARADVTLYTIGVRESHDLSVAKMTAERMDLKWVQIEITDDDIREGVAGIQSAIGDIGPLAISFEMPLYFVAKLSKEMLLTSGQGADELFGGYSRYETMDPALRREEMRKDVANLVSKGSPMERALAAHFGKSIVHPFLDPRVVDAALSLPDELIVNDGVRKVALREAGRRLGLTEEADRKKKAAQYGSGVMRAMKAMAKRDKMELRDWTSSLGLSKV